MGERRRCPWAWRCWGDFVTRELGYFMSFQNVTPHAYTVLCRQRGSRSRLAAGGLGSDGVSASPAGLGPSAGRKGIPRRSWGSAALSSAGLSFIEDPPKGNLKTLPSHPLAVQVRK